MKSPERKQPQEEDAVEYEQRHMRPGHLVVISGVAPGQGGAGQLLAQFLRVAQELGIAVDFFGPTAQSTRRNRRVPRAFRHPRKGIYRRFTVYRFWSQAFRRARQVGNAVVFHGQSVGWERVCALASAGVNVHVYVLDASFFCIRSYNNLPGEVVPCLRCVGDESFSAAQQFRCKAEPTWIRRGAALYALKRLRYCARHLGFITQNMQQEALLQRHFGMVGSFLRGGMVARDLADILEERGAAWHGERNPKTIVYHGSLEPAKGIGFFLKMMEALCDWKAIIPYTKGELRNVGRRLGIAVPRNVIARPMRWGGELQEAVASAEVVCVPSLWSAPIEGALMKSLAVGAAVATLAGSYAFAKEIPAGAVIHLPAEPYEAASLVRMVASDQGALARMRSCARSWAREQLEAMNEEMRSALIALSVGDSGVDERSTVLCSSRDYLKEGLINRPRFGSKP